MIFTEDIVTKRIWRTSTDLIARSYGIVDRIAYEHDNKRSLLKTVPNKTKMLPQDIVFFDDIWSFADTARKLLMIGIYVPVGQICQNVQHCRDLGILV
jgi:hypothetical protein